MSRVQRLRSMGMDWAADLIEGLMTDKLKLQLEVARLKRELRERKAISLVRACEKLLTDDSFDELIACLEDDDEEVLH